MCEESGGAMFGGASLVDDAARRRHLVGMREKDGFQFGLLSMALAAKLFNTGGSFAGYYVDLLDRYAVKHKYFHRHDERLYDERLTGEARQSALAQAEEKKIRIMDFFKKLAKDFQKGTPSGVIHQALNDRLAASDERLPVPRRLCLIGESVLEGTFIEFDTFWFVIRASGTDAVLRYYIEGEDRQAIGRYQDLLVGLKI